MLKSTIAARRARPARLGAGAERVTDPQEHALYRAQLDDHPLIRDAPGEQVARMVLEQVQFVSYRAGYAVMSAGETGDRLGLVLSGRCQVIVPADSERGTVDRRVGWVGPGDLLGEMSLLSNAPRRHTVVANRDTVLAEVPFSALDQLTDPVTRLALRGWLSETAARRALAAAVERPRGMTLTVLPLSAEETRPFAFELADALRALGDTCVVIERSRFEGRPSPLELTRIEQAHASVIYVADGQDAEWDARIMRQADRLLLVADAADDPRLRKVDLQAQDALAPVVLVLLQPPEPARIRHTARWLTHRPGRFHVHVRRGAAADMQRCARLSTGRGRGVVFAGASSQGLGYAGIVEAFEEIGFVPDVVTGNSSGSLTAATVAAGRTSAALRRQATEVIAAVRPKLSQGTLPVIALSDGTGATDYAKKEFGDLQMEDLPLPCVVTAVDISTLALRNLTHGPVWRAVRASTSIPILYPPVIDGDEVLIDGGALENYPVDQIAPLCERGHVLICDLSQDVPPMTDVADYGTTVGGLAALARRLKPFGRRERYPALGDIVFRMACLASQVHRDHLMERIQPNWTFIRPTAEAPGLFGIDAERARGLIRNARDHAREVLLRLDDLQPPAEVPPA